MDFIQVEWLTISTYPSLYISLKCYAFFPQLDYGNWNLKIAD